MASDTIWKWEKRLKEEGSLANKPVNRTWRKIDPERLKEYVAAHPTAYQNEIAEVFGCSKSGIQKALARLKITRKKGLYITKSRTRKK